MKISKNASKIRKNPLLLETTRIQRYSKKKEVLIFILLFPFLKPNIARDLWLGFGFVYDVLRVVSVLFIFLSVILSRRLPSRFSRYVIYYFSWIIMNAILLGADVVNAINQALVVIPCVLLVDLYSSYPREIINGSYYNVAILLYTNLLFVILYYPHGMYGEGNGYYFLCTRTRFIVYVIPLIILSVLCMYLFGKKIQYYVSIVVGLLNVFWPRSAGAMLVIAAMIIAWFFVTKNQQSSKQKSLRLLIIVALVLNIVIVYGFPIILKNQYITTFTTDVLHKSLTFSGRTIIWENAREAIANNFWFGLGNGYAVPFVGNITRGAHNQYMDLWLIGGIPGLLLFFYVFFYCIINKYHKKTNRDIKALFSVMLFGYMINFISESYYWQIMFVMLAIANMSVKISEYYTDTDYTVQLGQSNVSTKNNLGERKIIIGEMKKYEKYVSKNTEFLEGRKRL